MKNFDKNIFNNQLINWFDKNKRSLSFRENKDPYRIMVSEIMAQQTQISTMLPYYNRFLEKFPSIFDLANSNEDDVLKLWEGLGYYSRAKNLRKAAQQISEMKHFPTEYSELIKLPGIGPYTAGAIASLAFNKRIPALDGNALRVFSRIYGIKEDVSLNTTKKKINNLIQEHLEETDNPGTFNEALMEIGALICLKVNPKCVNCPVNRYCYAYKENLINGIPVKTKKQIKEIENYDVLIPLNNGYPLFIKRPTKGILAGLFGFPMIPNNGIPGSQLGKFNKLYSGNDINYLGESKHIFTHKIWISSVYSSEIANIPEEFTENPSSVPTAFKKMLKLLKKI